jgi:signal transduction histidine kinase
LHRSFPEKAVGPLTERQERFLNIVSANLERLSRLVNDLLDLSKIEAGKMALNKEDVDAVRLVEEVVGSMGPFAERKKVALSFEGGMDAPNTNVDRDRLVQVVTNLLSNAFRNTPEGGAVTVRAGLQTVDEGTNDEGQRTKDEGRKCRRVFSSLVPHM